MRRLLLIIGLSMSFGGAAHAALTNAQLQQHVGAWTQQFTTTTMTTAGLQQASFADLVTFGPTYISTGGLGIVSERTEAVQTTYRQLATRLGLNPTGTTNQVHFYKFHFLPVYISTTDRVAIEP